MTAMLIIDDRRVARMPLRAFVLERRPEMVLLEAAKMPHAVLPNAPWVTVSIDVASKCPTTETPAKLLLTLPYQAKGAGRNWVSVWNGDADS